MLRVAYALTTNIVIYYASIALHQPSYLWRLDTFGKWKANNIGGNPGVQELKPSFIIQPRTKEYAYFDRKLKQWSIMLAILFDHNI